MAKKKEETQIEEGKVRLYKTGAAGGYIDLDADHAERLLSLEKTLGAENYVLHIANGDSEPGSNKGDMEKAEE